MKIVTLHGLYMHGVFLIPLCERLEKQGHQVLNVSYNTLNPDLDDITAKINAFIGDQPAILVGHSMGGLIIRRYLEQHTEQNDRPPLDIRAVITLGTPHQGAKLARIFGDLGWGGWLFQRSEEMLIPDKVKPWQNLPPLHSLAGDCPWGPAALLLKDQVCDGTVLVEETQIEGMTSHDVYPVTHIALLFSRRVSERVIQLVAQYTSAAVPAAEG
ncbi:esterase/lipase family protein [Salinivibrio kushneri]|uniref:esterase/lipase family protein n=1 Tax=Salinivibrio kushneri TaxID=1908198 RepID=UPI0022B3E95C|nr:alpha/beta fold hydrolase [Salinivibrio kushneri]WBA12806.1 alpha/beta fold hydrolase [Salinivibrio kushneri]